MAEADFRDECLEKFDRLLAERAKIRVETPGQRRFFMEAYLRKSIEIDAVLDDYNSWRGLNVDLDQLMLAPD